jgi:hypothetical protein
MLLDEYHERPGPVIDIIMDRYDIGKLSYNLMEWRTLCRGRDNGWLG